MSIASTDQIADLITRIRNAVMVGKTQILVPTSKLKVGIAEVLAKQPIQMSPVSNITMITACP